MRKDVSYIGITLFTIVLSIVLTFLMVLLKLHNLIHHIRGTDVLEGEDLGNESFFIVTRILFPIALILAFWVSKKIWNSNRKLFKR